MSLSQEPVFSELKNHFVCGYRDISAEKYSGNSGAHDLKGQAVETNNGSGPHNIQLFILAPDATVLHCLPGYWNSKDLASELKLAQELGNLWQNASISIEQKKRDFTRMHLDHFKKHSKETIANSQMQNFDKHHELMKGKKSDALRYLPQTENENENDKKIPDDIYKTTDEIMHERLSKRAFLSYANFDTDKFVDYGTHFYDKHEDNLDENGKSIENESKTLTMKEFLHKSKTKNLRDKEHTYTPQLQVKTYGVLRNKQ